MCYEVESNVRMCWSHVNGLWLTAVRDESSEACWGHQPLAELFKSTGFSQEAEERGFGAFLCCDLLTQAKSYLGNRDEKPWQSCPRGTRSQSCSVCPRTIGVIKLASVLIFARLFIHINWCWTYSLAVPFGWVYGIKKAEAAPGASLIKAPQPQFFKAKVLPQAIAGGVIQSTGMQNPVLSETKPGCISSIEHNQPSSVASTDELCIGICSMYQFWSVSVSRTAAAAFIWRWLCPPHNASDL